jgi:hypothetical protein
MNRYRTSQRYVQLIMSFTAGLWLLAFPLFAQVELRAGSISGRVRDSGGQALPGVSVTLTGIAAPQTFVTDSEGNYRFLNLSPGRYSLTAELQGMGSAKRAADVIVGSNTEADLKLAASVSEAITVTAATPVIDRREIGTGANISPIELQEVPTARDPWVVLQSAPGVMMDRVNVGGNKSGQQSYFISKGVERSQTAWNLDGVPSSDMAATGTSAFYYDFDSFQEMNISTGSADPSVQTPGAQVNMVTKRGTNELKGSGRFFDTASGLQSKATVPSEVSKYATPLVQVNSINRVDDYGVEAGGPLVADRLWIWGAVSRNTINNAVSGALPVDQKFTLKNYNAKLNGQLSSANAANIYWMYSDKIELHRGAGPLVPVESTRNQKGPGYVLKLEDTHSLSPNFYLTGKVSHIKNGYELDPVGGRNTTAYYNHDGAIPNGSYKFFSQNVPQDAAHIDGSNFFHAAGWDHELKYGFGYRNTPVQSITSWPGNGTFGNFYDDPSSNDVAITRDARPNFGSNYQDAFLGDTIIHNRLTLTAGVRYDRDSAKNRASSVAANPAFPDILPAASFAGDKQALVWKGISPRIGMTYELGSDHRTVLRASYSRYMDQLGSSAVGASNPFYQVQMIYYYWTDLNHDNLAQRNELGDFETSRFVDPKNPTGLAVSNGRLDYGMKPPQTNEFILGTEREIMPAFALGVNYTYRKRTNLLWDQYEKTRGSGDFYTSADFVPAATPLTGTLPNGQAYTVNYYNLKAGSATPTYYVTTNRPDFYQTYNDLEFTAIKRMENNWMLRAAVTLSDTKQHVGSGAIVDPSPVLNVFGVSGAGSNSCVGCQGSTLVASNSGEDGYINSKWNVALNGVYQFPYQVTFGTAFTARQGYVIPYYFRFNSGDRESNRRFLVDGFGNDRLDNVYELDFRLAKSFAVRNGLGIELSADLFNALNQRTVLWRDNRIYRATGKPSNVGGGNDLSIGSNNIVEVQSPRVIRLGARVSF